MIAMTTNISTNVKPAPAGPRRAQVASPVGLDVPTPMSLRPDEKLTPNLYFTHEILTLATVGRLAQCPPLERVAAATDHFPSYGTRAVKNVRFRTRPSFADQVPMPGSVRVVSRLLTLLQREKADRLPIAFADCVVAVPLRGEGDSFSVEPLALHADGYLLPRPLHRSLHALATLSVP